MLQPDRQDEKGREG